MTTKTKAPAAVTVDARLFFRAVLNVALGASTDDTLPSICCVRLRCAGDGTLTAEATDRYVLFLEDVPAEGGPLDVLLPAKELAAHVKTLAGILKTASGRVPQADPPQVRISPGTGLASLTLTRYLGPDTTLAIRPSGGEFPDTSRHFARLGGLTPGTGGGQAIAQQFWNKLGKVDNGEPARNRFVHLRFYEPGEEKYTRPDGTPDTRTVHYPALAWLNGSAFRAVIMPVRRKDDQPPGTEPAPSPAAEHDDQPDTRPASAKYTMTVERTGREHRIPPVPAGVEEPTVSQLEADLERAAYDSGSPRFETSCSQGCEVEPDGRCSHGHPTWLVRAGLI